MNSGARIIATISVSILLASAVFADDTPKLAVKAAKDEAAKFSETSRAPDKSNKTPAGKSSFPGSLWGSDDKNGHAPRVEVFFGYSFLRSIQTDYGNRLAWLHGGSTSVAFNLNRYFGIVGDFGGYDVDRFGPFALPIGGVVSANGSAYSYLFGPRISFRHRRFTPYVQVLVGGMYATNVTIPGCMGIGCTPLPVENVFALTAGGGLDITLYHHVALRLFQAEYLMTTFVDRTSVAGNTAIQNDARLSTGIVFRFGGGDHASPPPPPNRPPSASCSVDKSSLYAGSGDFAAVRAQADDSDNDSLTYSWAANGGAIEGSGPVVRWNSSNTTPGTYTVRARVDNGRGSVADCSADIRVELRPHRPPTISCSADRTPILQGESIGITAIASDPDNDPLSYAYSSKHGQISGSGPNVRFDSTGLPVGSYAVNCNVSDGRGGSADATANIDVQAPPPPPEIVELEARLALHSIYFQTSRPTTANPGGGMLESQRDVITSLATDFRRYLTFKPDAHLILGGHADPRGSIQYNKDLTERRVERAKQLLVAQGVPAGSIDVRSYGKEDELNADQVKEQMQENPDLSPNDRQRMLDNLSVIVLANNRRVDISLSTTGQQSTRRYPFNAKDALALISTKGGDKATAAKRRVTDQ